MSGGGPKESQPIQWFVKGLATTIKGMGLIRVGKSRVWLKDGGWRLVVVELQPSSWSKGSYLNVGTMFLLAQRQSDALRITTFDAGQYRVLPFHSITTQAEAEQAQHKFEFSIAAAVAREEFCFGNLHSAAAELRNQEVLSLHGKYNAMLLLALLGKGTESAKVAAEILDAPAPYEWIQRVQANTRAALTMIEHQDNLEFWVISNIQSRRAGLGLKMIPDADVRSLLKS